MAPISKIAASRSRGRRESTRPPTRSESLENGDGCLLLLEEEGGRQPGWARPDDTDVLALERALTELAVVGPEISRVVIENVDVGLRDRGSLPTGGFGNHEE